MTLYAFDAIDDALAATRSFLWPFELGRWARLALVVFFVGGFGGFNPFQGNFGGTGTGGGPDQPVAPGAPGVSDVLSSIGGAELAVILLIVAVIVLIALVIRLVGSIMDFVFVESLRREEVTIRRYWGERWGQGLRLFGFRFVLALLAGGIVLLLAYLVLAPTITGGGDPRLDLLLVAIPVFLAVAIVAGLVNGFTTVFVVPVMIVEDCGVLAGWSRFWPTLRGQWKQYAVYAVMGFVLQIAVGIVAGIATLLALIVLAIPFVVFGLVGFALLAAVPPVGFAVVAIAVVTFLLLALVVSLFIAVPVQSFLRYYALFVLGDTNEDFDLVAERRRLVREDDGEPSTSAS